MVKLQVADMVLEEESQVLVTAYRKVVKEQNEQQKPEVQKKLEEQREMYKNQIAETVNKQFDVRQQRHELELKRLEEQLKKLREIVERRTKARKTLVEKRIADLVGPEEPGVEF